MSETGSGNKASCQLAARYGAYDDYDDDYYKLRSIHSTTRHYIYCYAYALPNSNSEGKCRGINKERAGHSGKYLNLFTSDRTQSRRFRMECILQIDSNDRVGVHILDGHKWGVLSGKKGTDELKKSEDK